KEIVGKIKTRQIKKDKNGLEYLLLRLTTNESIFVFPQNHL
ncbi:4167_t:CDS:1, partial [Racocetra fulgida]